MIIYILYGHNGPHPENLTLLHLNNKGADMPAHPCSLISAFVSHYQ